MDEGNRMCLGSLSVRKLSASISALISKVWSSNVSFIWNLIMSCFDAEKKKKSVRIVSLTLS